MTFKEHRQALNEGKDPPMLLTLRRQGIRNFAGGERVALFSNPQLNIQLAIPYDAATGTLKPSNVQMKEEHDGYSAGKSREEIEASLTAAYKHCIGSEDKLCKAIHGWLKSEIEEFGEFDNMPEENLRDNWDDYCALTKGSDLEEETILERVQRQRVIDNFADWHEAAEKKGGTDVKFKLHNAGASTSAYSGEKHLGTFHHTKNTGHLFEEVLEESPIHRINTILKTGVEQNIIFHNGAAGRVHPHTAKAVHDLFHKVNSSNKSKLSELINSSPDGLEKVHKFAQQLAAAAAKKEAKK